MGPGFEPQRAYHRKINSLLAIADTKISNQKIGLHTFCPLRGVAALAFAFDLVALRC
jgi:hypothetical protein